MSQGTAATTLTLIGHRHDRSLIECVPDLLEEPNGVVLLHALWCRRETEFFDSIANLVPIDAEQSRGLCLVASRPLQRLNDEAPFELLQVDSSGRQIKRIPGAETRLQSAEVVRLQSVTFRQQHGAFDDVTKFTDVAGPAVRLEQGDRPGARAGETFFEFGVERVDEEVH